MSEKKPELYEKLELKIKAWEAEKPTVAESDVVRLSETILPDHSTVNMYQMVAEAVFVIVLEQDNNYQVIFICSDYIESYSKLLAVLEDLMFGSTDDEERDTPVKNNIEVLDEESNVEPKGESDEEQKEVGST